MTDDILLQEAIEAVRQGQHERARELLTRLIKTNQNNVEYWLWMSAAVDTIKERTYCLQTALQIDPNNAAAKRGLIMIGGMQPDESVQPFPLRHARPWQDELVVAGAETKERSPKAFFSSPIVKLFGLLLLGAIATGTLIFMFSTPRNATNTIRNTHTAGPSPTFTTTPTALNARANTVTPTFVGPTPLALLLEIPYTPTPKYVRTPHEGFARDTFRAAEAALDAGNWDLAILHYQEAIKAQPDAIDAYFYLGEAYRMKEQYLAAFNAYEQALDMDPTFGPAYLGRARVIPFLNPEASIRNDIENAIKYSPDYLEAYIARAEYFLEKGNPEGAILDMQTALEYNPNYALAYVLLARIYIETGEYHAALTNAQKANQIDITLLDAYWLLGQAYQLTGQIAESLRPLHTYTLFETENANALVLLGNAYLATADYENALDTLNRAIALDKRIGEAFLYRGLANLRTGQGEDAENDFKNALRFFPRNFDATMGLAESYYLQAFFGDMYNQTQRARAVARTEDDFAQVYYWQAIALERTNNLQIAYNLWQDLLSLPPDAMPAEWRAQARQQMSAIKTPTPGLAPTELPTRTPTATPAP